MTTEIRAALVKAAQEAVWTTKGPSYIHEYFQHDHIMVAALSAAFAKLREMGWRMVPVEETEEMYLAALRITRDPGYGHCADPVGGMVYRAMISAAPDPLAEGE